MNELHGLLTESLACEPGGDEAAHLPTECRFLLGMGALGALDRRVPVVELLGMQLRINPKLWGTSWHDPELIEVAFAQLAKVLQGDQQGG